MNPTKLEQIGKFKQRFETSFGQKVFAGCGFLLLICITLFFVFAAADAISNGEFYSPFKSILSVVSIAIWGVATLLMIALMIYLTRSVLRMGNFKFDLHECGFAYYQRNKTVIATWEEVEGVQLRAGGGSFRTSNNEVAYFNVNERNSKKFDKIVRKQIVPRVLEKIRAKIKNGEKVKFGALFDDSRLTKKLLGKSIMLDHFGVYQYREAEPPEIIDFMAWKDVSDFGIEERKQRYQSEMFFYVSSEEKKFSQILMALENVDTLETICREQLVQHNKSNS